MSTPNDKLLAAVKARTNPNPFNYGIGTADAFVKTLRECVGSDICYRYAATRKASFNDVMSKAAKTLVYGTPDMLVEEITSGQFKSIAEVKIPGIELPKNTLMVFRHRLTSPRKDRDGDVLRTKGAQIDMNMLLLWQHVHTLPIGKYLATYSHTEKALDVYSCIIDMNELCHDSAVMIDNKMGRFSHGFRALEYSELKAEIGKPTSPGGFDVKSFEIMEESLVSVPSNVDATVDEVILDLVESKKLKSPLYKAQGRAIRERRNVTIPVTVDLKMMINGKEMFSNGQFPELTIERTPETKCTGDAGCSCGCTSEEAHDDADQGAPGDKAAQADEMMDCPKCGSPMEKGGTCKCGYTMEKAAKMSDAVLAGPMSTSGDTGGYLAGSYEHIGYALRNLVRKYMLITGTADIGERDWIYTFATFSDSVVVGVQKDGAPTRYFKINYTKDGNSYKLTGDPVEVFVETTTHLVAKAFKAMTHLGWAPDAIGELSLEQIEFFAKSAKEEEADPDGKDMCPKCKIPLNGDTCDECGYTKKKGFCPTGPGGGIDNSCGRGDGEHEPFGAAGSNPYGDRPAFLADRHAEADVGVRLAAKKVKQAQTALDAAKAQLPQAKVAKLEQELADIRTRKADLQKKLAESKARIAALRAQLKKDVSSDLDKEIETLDEIIKEVNDINDRLEAVIDACRRKQITFEDAAATVLALATPAQRDILRRSLDTLDLVSKEYEHADAYKNLIGVN